MVETWSAFSNNIPDETNDLSSTWASSARRLPVTVLFIFSLFQIIGGLMLVAGYPSQFMKLLKRKSAQDFSLFWVGTIFAGITFMEVYAVWLFIKSGMPALAFPFPLVGTVYFFD